MSAWIDAIASPLKAASESIQKLIEIRDTVKFGEEAGKLYAQILAALQGAIAAQTRESALLDDIGALKKHIAELESWEREKSRYRLQELPPRVFVYSLDPAKANSEPPHDICKTCYQRGKKSILDSDAPYNGIHNLTCNECGAKLQVGHFRPAPEPDYRPHY